MSSSSVLFLKSSVRYVRAPTSRSVLSRMSLMKYPPRRCVNMKMDKVHSDATTLNSKNNPRPPQVSDPEVQETDPAKKSSLRDIIGMTTTFGLIGYALTQHIQLVKAKKVYEAELRKSLGLGPAKRERYWWMGDDGKD